MARTVVLGAGFGGIAVATELRRLLGDGHEVVLIDRRDEFSMGLRKLWELVGIGTIADGSRPRRLLAGDAVRFVPASVEAIDPIARTVRCDGADLHADFLVVALGAEPRPDLIPGMAAHAHNVWDRTRVHEARAALEAFGGGRIAVVIAGAPYPCPPAPYECVMLVDEWLRDRALRERTELTVSTFQPILLPNAGSEGSAWLGEQLAARGARSSASSRDGSSTRTANSRPTSSSACRRTGCPPSSPTARSPTMATGSASIRGRSRPASRACSRSAT
jgi:sulfide:quinone oxidoreductase